MPRAGMIHRGRIATNGCPSLGLRDRVVDERHVGAEDLPGAGLMKAVPGLEQSHTPGDLVRVAGRPVEWLRDPRMTRG